MLIKLFFFFILLVSVFILLIYLCKQVSLRVILVLMFLLNCVIISYMGYNLLKYNSAEGLSQISIQFRKEYLDIEDAISKNPSYKTLERLTKWNNDVREMQKEAKIWMDRSYFDWREINPIKIDKYTIEKIIKGEYKLHKYKIIEVGENP